MQEKERKFLLKYLPEFETKQQIEQGYLMVDGNKNLRVRIIHENDTVSAFITFKIIKSDFEKEEFEFPINISEAKEMMNSTQEKFKKTRYKTCFNGNLVDIDVFEDGTSWCEIEYTEEINEFPDYFGEEVTGDKKLNNIYMAKQKVNI